MASPTRKRAKRIVPFLEAHECLYGVRVVERDPASHEATSVLCMFCAAFGREDDPRASSRQRARTQKPKYWNGPTFRTDNYKSHLTMQHPMKWKQYQELMTEQKQSYFDAVPALPKNQNTRRSLDKETGMTSTVQSSAVLQSSIATSSEQDNETPVSAPVSPAIEVVATDFVESGGSFPVPAREVQSPVVVTSSLEAGSESVLDEDKVLAFLLDRDVVEMASGDVLFRAEDLGNDGGKTVVSFESTLDPRDTEDQQRSDGAAEVRAVVRSVGLFHRVVDLLAVGLTFDQTAAVCQAQVTAGIRDNTFVASMARVAVGANIQALAGVLQRGWAFSLSLHSVDRRRSGETEPRMFLDIRLRAYCSGNIRVFHLLALPMETGRDPSATGELLFETMAKFLHSVHKRWLQKVISCSIEVIRLADSSISSVISAVALSLARRVEQQALPGFVRVSSAQPPLDTLMQRFFDSVLFSDGAEWHAHLTSLLPYLQRQMNIGNTEELSSASVTTCPCISDMTWLKLTEITRWIDSARVPIQRLLARRNASIAPPPVWWLTLKVALVVGSMALKTRAGLQEGYATLLSQQPQRISMLRLALAGDVGVEGPLPAYQRAALRDQSSLGEMIGSNDDVFAVKPHSIVEFVRGMGSWAAELFDELNAQDRQKIIVGTADRILDLVQGLHSLAENLEEHGSRSSTSLSSFPPVLPHQVALLHPTDFQEIVRVYRPRLAETFSGDKLTAVETQHSELRTAAANEAAVRQLLDLSGENPASSFNQSWEALRTRWGLLVEFYGGLATVFPTSNVDTCTSNKASSAPTTGSQCKLVDFSLEARLQCQQFATLQALQGWS